ncbi:probable histone-lysine N-methyltransferase 2A [Coccomyxa sp. Obi]|nr:probable histone-lysine N-methyltransferase 2A [Coccomyxa sp. Obi]
MCSVAAECDAGCRYRLKAVKKQHSGLVAIGRRSLNAYAAVLVAKKKMGRFIIRRSDISGLGVFTLEFCEAGELLMECVGEVVRRPVASMREAAAAARERHDVACYMFALDADFVVDTTKAGNLARFVNHSCSPNCVASAMDVKGARHIFLIAARQLAPGEELT